MTTNDEQDIKLLGFPTKDHMIDYGKLVGKTCLQSESVRAMYLKISGRPFEDLEDECNKQKLHAINNKVRILNKCFYIDFSNGLFNRFDVGKTFYFNEKGIFCKGEIKPKLDILFYNVTVLELESGELKEVKYFPNWLSVKNNYFKIKKICNFGQYYISFKKIKIYLYPIVASAGSAESTQKTINTNNEVCTLSKKELEKIESDKSIENISKNLKEISLNERAMYLLQNITDTKVDDEQFILDRLKDININEEIINLPEETIDTFIKPLSIRSSIPTVRKSRNEVLRK